MNKTVWYISKYFPVKTDDSPGGRSWFLMKEMAKKGYKTVVITSDSNNVVSIPKLHSKITIEQVDDVTLIFLKTFKYKVAKSLRRMLSWFHFEWRLLFLDKSSLSAPNVIVVSSLSLLTVLNGLWLRKKYRCRLVFEVRDIWPLTIVEEGGFNNWNPFVLMFGFVEKLGYKHADIIVGTMPNLGQHVEDVLGYQRDVFCIPMGVDPSVLDDGDNLSPDYVKSYLTHEDKLKVVHVGTIGITNALEIFFEAAEALKVDERVHFILVGDGALKEHYMQKYGCLPNITFAPKVPRNKVQSVLSSCSVLYFSTFKSKVWDYGQSLNKVIDYMLSGKPIVASFSGYPSMINEAGCGSFVPAEDVQLLVKEIHRYRNMSSQELARLGNKGKEWLLTHRTYKQLASDYIAVMFK
jgi:glycosyltransferase involved in cell wall biosynthesis